jgi:hypothetical protein
MVTCARKLVLSGSASRFTSYSIASAIAGWLGATLPLKLNEPTQFRHAMPAIDAGPTMFRLCHDIGGPIAIASPEPVSSPIRVLIAGTGDGHLH